MTTTTAPASVLVIPVDPESLDATRPVDLDTCHVCMGNTTVYVGTDPATGIPMDDTCPRCHGTGQLPGLGGAA